MPTERHESTLLPPNRPLDLSRIPAISVGYGGEEPGTWYRSYQKYVGDTKRDCRYFSPKRGRFDLNMPNGTRNLASTPEAALRERLGPRLIGLIALPMNRFDGVYVARVQLPRVFKVADFRQAFGGFAPGDISSALFHAEGYSVTQQWAEAVREAGLEGIIARSRFSSGSALYLFGTSGENREFGSIGGEETALSVARAIPFFPEIVSVEEEEFEFE